MVVRRPTTRLRRAARSVSFASTEGAGCVPVVGWTGAAPAGAPGPAKATRAFPDGAISSPPPAPSPASGDDALCSSGGGTGAGRVVRQPGFPVARSSDNSAPLDVPTNATPLAATGAAVTVEPSSGVHDQRGWPLV